MIFVFDIDGTLADILHRLHFIQEKPANWPAFFAASADDKPIWEVIAIARALAKAGNTLVMSTGRSADIRKITEDWLRKYRIPFHDVYMRNVGDHREDNIVKSELYDQILDHYNISKVDGVFEDRQQVVDMYRERGVRVFQVAKGDF